MAAVLFDDPTLLPKSVRPEDFTAACAFFDDAAPMKSAYVPDSAVLAQCGYAILAGESYHCVFKCGGETADSGHSNNDQLALTLCVGGETLVVDPGTYSYTGDLQWRTKLRRLTAHSTVFVDEEETDRLVAMTAFGGGGTDTRSKCLRFDKNYRGVSCTAAHDGYFRLPEMLTVERTVDCCENRITVTDCFKREHDVPADGKTVERFLLHPECSLRIIDAHTAVVVKNGQEVVFTTEDGQFSAEEADYSPTYGVRQKTLALSVILSRNARKNRIIISWR